MNNTASANTQNINTVKEGISNMSSQESTNANIQSDIEIIETDVDDTVSILTDKPYTITNTILTKKEPTCFVSGNSNLIVNNYNDNFQFMENIQCHNETQNNYDSVNINDNVKQLSKSDKYLVKQQLEKLPLLVKSSNERSQMYV